MNDGLTKKKRIQIQEEYIKLREENRQLKAQQSCVESDSKSLYTCETSFHKNSEKDPKV